MNANVYRSEIEREIRDNGFAVVGPLVDPDTVAQMRAALEIAVAGDIQRWSDNPWYKDHWMVHNLLQRDRVFLRFLDNPLMHEYLSRLLSPSCILYAYTSSSLPANGSNLSRRIHVDSQAEAQGYATNIGVLLALDDFSDDNGATYYLPGSHLSLEVPGNEAFFERAVRVYPKAGEAVIFNARTYHYGGTNTTQTPRHAVTLNVCRHWMKQRFDYPRMLSNEQLSELGPVGRRFVGMDSRTPSSLEEYYVAPEDRLFKGGQY
ncbi:phytanoyl-CoA dioxygenase family protein [Pseudomonas sp. CGJS7]|uniref:phytanoyl-CoA dioxygenase family protein n=1 Tax=Pseudomonas sp. CGJS7 TaxID=3109348 RepID=UPI00300A5D40